MKKRTNFLIAIIFLSLINNLKADDDAAFMLTGVSTIFGSVAFFKLLSSLSQKCSQAVIDNNLNDLCSSLDTVMMSVVLTVVASGTYFGVASLVRLSQCYRQRAVIQTDGRV